jgi:hypothetical protein
MSCAFCSPTAEAGFLRHHRYLTSGFPLAHRSHTVARFTTAPALSGVVGAPRSKQ